MKGWFQCRVLLLTIMWWVRSGRSPWGILNYVADQMIARELIKGSMIEEVRMRCRWTVV